MYDGVHTCIGDDALAAMPCMGMVDGSNNSAVLVRNMAYLQTKSMASQESASRLTLVTISM